MKVLLILGSFVVPMIMVIMQNKWSKFRLIFNLIAILAALTFGNMLSLAIYQILHDNTVFMTNIHGILLNPFFLLTGAYLGVYLVYTITLNIFQDVSSKLF
ncbi:transposase [Alkalihalobacterium alkalinitrilicum]|uniref:transposase n=1 Tax=Alkalihalobacterium alkalinitrilicum TaxID=427920 RepID=UPI0009958915|nr:transposase [Alkalihalobacterium alkalinitrilicum]